MSLQPPKAAELAVKENMIAMSTMSTIVQRSSRVARRPHRFACRLLLAAALLLLGLASPALAEPVWSVTSHHGSQNMPPGGTGQYVIQVYNDGTDPQTGTVTVTDTLPPGLIATAATSPFPNWSCSGLGTGTVTCTQPDSPGFRLIQPPGPALLHRGAASPLFITVSVDPGVAASEDNTVTVSGGGALSDATTVDPTTFSTAPTLFGFVPGSFLADVFDGPTPEAAPVRQAGSHPFEVRVNFDMNLKLTQDPDRGGTFTEPAGLVHNLEVRLPRGFIGNPEATPKCTAHQLMDSTSTFSQVGNCPVASQVGTIELINNNGDTLTSINGLRAVPVYNMVPPPGAVAAFAFMVLGQPVWIKATLDPSDYSVVTRIDALSTILPVRTSHLRLWGVPADPAHDPLRFDPATNTYGAASSTPVKPFLTLPYDCTVSGATHLQMDSWENEGTFVTADSPTTSVTGCDDPRFRFQPSISAAPTTTRAGAPAGLSFDLTVPQKDDTIESLADVGKLYAPNGNDVALNTPPVRAVTVTLPQGVAISPSSASGLAACTPLQIGLGSNDDPTCPDASKIGSVRIVTPLLADPLEGPVYLAQQDQNPFGTLLALYLVAKGPGVIVKLPGKVELDPSTGQVTSTFDDNPQLTFSSLHLELKSGPRAPLMMPVTCGTKTTTAQITSWNAALPAVTSSSSFVVSADGNGAPCAAQGFHPSLDDAGAVNPIGGADSPLTVTFSRPDGDQDLGAVDLSLPKGLIGRVAKVVLCPDGPARAGTCPEASRIGSVTTEAGPGPDPFSLPGRVYMTGPYRGAPFGLSIVVPAVAGPLNLGTVVVRAAVYVDPATAALRIVSDPLPTMLQGIPLQVRLVNVLVDRTGFMLNPTSCRGQRIAGRISSSAGASVNVGTRFQLAECGRLPFAPSISLRVGRKGHTGRNHSTPLAVHITMKGGQSNLAVVDVTLPTVLDARLGVVNRACTLAQYHAGHCEQARVGSASVVTPLLRNPLRGGVYFVRNPRRVLPDMIVALRGQVAVDLTGKVTVLQSGQLRTRFDTAPDVPIRSFRMSVVDGRNGPLGVVTNLCSAKARRARIAIGLRAHNGKTLHISQLLAVSGCPRKHRGGR
jgi:uncharacterized repeat protein (TIGR01451 family)